MENLFLNKEKYQEYVKEKENIIKNRILEKEILLSGGDDKIYKKLGEVNNFEDLSEKYQVKLEFYKETEKNYWNIIKVIILKENKEIFSFIRDYSSISICYVQNNNMDYLIFTGESYMGFSIYNLTKNTFFSYIPVGNSWCPIEIIDYYEDANILHAYGCYWGCEYEYRDYRIEDLDNPIFDDYESYPDD